MFESQGTLESIVSSLHTASTSSVQVNLVCSETLLLHRKEVYSFFPIYQIHEIVKLTKSFQNNGFLKSNIKHGLTGTENRTSTSTEHKNSHIYGADVTAGWQKLSLSVRVSCFLRIPYA